MGLTDARFFLRIDGVEPEAVECGTGEAIVVTRPGPDRSGAEANEDGAMVIAFPEGRGVLAVADGVGGGRAGGDAAGAALEALAGTLAAAVGRGQSLRAAILDGIERAQIAVRSLGGGAATTLAVAGLDGDRLRPFHVGDSEILLLGQRGRVKHRTISHGPVAYAVESGYLGEREAMHHDERHLVTNALGLPEYRIEIGPRLRVAPRDTLLLATDGLTDNLFLEEIVEGLRAGEAMGNAERLSAAARRRMTRPTETRPGKPDDLTFVSWRRGHIETSAGAGGGAPGPP